MQELHYDYRYNYVIFGTKMDLYKVSYADIKNEKNARYLTEGIYNNNFFLKLLYKIHTSERINLKFKLPFKSIWNCMAYRNDFENTKPICYIFFAGTYWFSKDYLSYLKEKEPECRIVIFYQDLVKTHSELFHETNNLVDLSVTFDQGDAKKYYMLYHPLVYSKLDDINDQGYDSDVYFVGKAKDRLEYILEVYNKLKSYGLKCDFHITGVSKENQIMKDEIDYCNQMSYKENLSHIKGTKCILEIMQGGGKGFTLRYAEAIMYDKKMITNNPEIINADFYSEDKIMAITDADDIKKSFLDTLDEKINYECKNELSPLTFINFIDRHLLQR